MVKKVKEIKNYTGKDITRLEGSWCRIRCTTNTGEQFNIPFKLLFKLLDKYEFNCERFGDRFRAIEFYQRGED
jgi:hypothetical protein